MTKSTTITILGDDMALGGLADIFNYPAAYNVLPYKNYDTDDEKPALTGFFLPSHKFALLKEYVDARGVTDHVRFKEFYMAKRKKLTDKALIDECAEHCFTPREALIKHGDNMFDSVALSQRMMQLQIQHLGNKLTHMQLLWDKTKGNGMEVVNAFESKDSKLIVVEPPIVDENKANYKNLYVAGIDSIDMGTSESATDYDVSDFCVIIYKRVFGMDEPRIVAMYKDRPKNIREAYDLTLKLLTWYNCQAMLEYTKISIIQYFTERGKRNLFMSRPEWASSNGNFTRRRVNNKALIGVPSTMACINHGLELVGNFVADYWHTIDFPEIVEQLLNYTLPEKRKFDCVAALQMVMLGDEALTGINPVAATPQQKQWKDFG